jgi:hypothetical protein
VDFLGLPVRCSIPSPREDDTRSWQLVFNLYRTGTYQSISQWIKQSLTHSLITLTGIYNYIYIARSSVPNCKAVTSPPFSTSRCVLRFRGTGSPWFPVPRCRWFWWMSVRKTTSCWTWPRMRPLGSIDFTKRFSNDWNGGWEMVFVVSKRLG